MRNKLIELILKCEKENDVLACYHERPKNTQAAEIIADYLLANGVIVPPCKVGDKCYPLPSYKAPIVERKISRITFSKRNIIIGYYENDGRFRPPLRTSTLGNDVFLTREEAEQALKGEHHAEIH